MTTGKLLAAVSFLWHGASGVRVARGKPAFIHGVPLYGNPQVSRSSASRSSSDVIVAFRRDVHDSDIEQFCGKHICSGKGHPSQGGVAFAGATMGPELDAAVKEHANQLEFLEYDAELQDYDNVETAAQASVQWNIQRVGVPNSKFTGEGTHIYVLDSGIRNTHVDFGGRAIPTLDANEPLSICDPSDKSCALDGRGHGTHCAGSAGGTTYGVAPKALLYAANRGVSFLDSFNAIDWIILNANKPAVLTMSFGGAGTYMTAKQVMDSVVEAGIPVTVAAGNSEMNACGFTWAYLPTVITVGSTKDDDRMSYFSNYGDCVDIFAPGQWITSASHTSNNGTKSMQGTSMACPHVAGGAALILQDNPSFTPAEVKAELIKNAEKNAVVGRTFGSPNRLLKVVPK